MTDHRPAPDSSRARGTECADDNREAGFTLVEVLVTLALMAMVAAIVFGSLRPVFEARGRLRPYLDQSEETVLAASWFRQTVQSVIPDYPEAKDRFVASEAVFSGLSASPLLGAPGTPTGFRWELKYDPNADVTALVYAEGEAKSVRIASWRGRRGAFAYFGPDDRQWHPTWPVERSVQSAELARLPQFPALIRLGGLPPEVFPTVLAAPRAAPFSRPLPRDLFSGS